MNTLPSWNQIYAAGTADKPKSESLSSLAFRELVKKSAAPIGSSAPKTSRYQGDLKQPEKNGFEKFVDTPIIKSVIDALSIGNYATANAADDVIDGVEKLNKGDLGGILDIAASPVTGIVKGSMAAVGDESNTKTWADIIERGQKAAGLDTENDAAKWTQGIGGFVGDVALDPTTYLSLGGSALVKGATRGFVEGGKGAARKAAEGARKAADEGGELVGRAAEINSAGDKAGFINRFKEAGVQAEGDYKEWMRQNGGKIAKWEIPFKGSKNPKDAVGIESQSLGNTNRDSLRDLVDNDVPVGAKAESPKQMLELEQLPFKAGADGVTAPGRFNSPVPEKTPEVLAEEQNIVDGLREAAKTDAPIVDDAVKAPKAKSNDELVADEIHANMGELMSTIKFTRQMYGADTLKAYEDAFKASQPQSVTKSVEAEPAPAQLGKVDAKKMIAAIQRAGANEAANDAKIGTIRYGGKQVHPRVIARDWDNAPTQQAKIAVLRKIDPAFANAFREKIEAPKAAPQEITEQIDGIPIDYDGNPALAGLAAEHRDLPVEELLKLRSPVNDQRGIAKYINEDISDEELVLMAEKLGLPSTADKSDIRKLFMERYKEWKKRTAEELKASKLTDKAPKEPREQVGGPNQESAQILDKVSVAETDLRRATRAIKTREAMLAPFRNMKVGGEPVKTDLLSVRDIVNLPENAVNNALKVQSGQGRPYKMDGGANSDTPNKLTGTAIYPDRWGTQSAVAIHASLIKGVSSIATDYMKKSGQRLPAMIKMELYKRGVVASMAQLRAMGIAPYLDLGRGAKDSFGVNLGMDDLAELMFKEMETRFFAGPMKGMQPQAFATGVEALIRAKIAGKSTEDVVEDIMKAFTGSEGIYRGKYKDAEGIIRGTDKTDIIASIKGVDADGVRKPGGMEMAIDAIKKTGKSASEARAIYLADLRKTAEKWANDDALYQNLNNRMLVNAKEHGVELGKMVDQVSEATLAKIMAAGTKPISTGDFLDEMRQIIKDGKAALGEADETKYLLWEKALDDMRSKIISKGEQTSIKSGEKVAKIAEEVETAIKEAPTKVNPKTGETVHVITDAVLKTRVRVEEAVKVANMKSADNSMREAEDFVGKAKDQTSDPNVGESFDVFNSAVSIDTMRRIHPISSFFSAKFGLDASGMHGAIGSGLHTQVRMQSIFHGGVMNYLAKNPAKLMDDWKTLQNEASSHIVGDVVQAFEPSSQSAKELYEVINMIFDVSKDNIITRNGLGARHWNAAAKAKGLDLEMDETLSMLDNSRVWLKKEGLDSTEKVLEFLSKSHAVAANLASDIAIASNFARTFGSAKPKPGYARLDWSKRGYTKNKTASAGEKEYGFFDLLPKSVYYDVEAAKDIANIHRTLNEARAIKPTGVMGSFMVNVFNPITNILKASQTVVRPGHWVNNILGDTMRNYMAGVVTITPYRHAIAMLKANGKEMKMLGDNPLEAYKWHKQTTDGDFEVHGRGNGVVIHIGGKPQKISYESLFRLMQDGPIMPKHHGAGVAEDFLTPEDTSTMNRFGQALDKAQTKVLDNDAFSINALATARDNLGRIPLALDFAMKGKFKDIHELKAAMEQHVAKWVPTSTDFTAREAKYVRPAFMYYTWLRGITPRVIDTLMNKPGVALAPSKALYNLAVANGVDPVSFGNPFPPEAQMPSYFYDGVIGPTMKGEGPSLWGFNIANPVTDVMNTFGKGITPEGIVNGDNATSMLKTALGSASPFAKIPIDLATGESNGIPIQSTNQYLQDSLTGSWGGLISKSTGQLWNGEGRTDSTNGLAHGEDQSDIAALQIANFLSGLKLTDYQSPSALRSYVGEQKAEIGDIANYFRRNM